MEWINKLICRIKGHLWAEWEHSDRSRNEFFRGTAILKRTECVRCHNYKPGKNIIRTRKVITPHTSKEE